jgi:hypothetical protein
MSLENILRGSGDLGAMLSAGWGLRQIESERNTIFVANTKARDFEPCLPFLLQGRPSLDEHGTFAMVEPPGKAQALRHYRDENKETEKGGRPAMPDRDAKAVQAAELRASGLSIREIAAQLAVSKSTADRLLFASDASQKSCPNGTGFRDNTEPRTEVGGEASPKDFPTSGLGVLGLSHNSSPKGVWDTGHRKGRGPDDRHPPQRGIAAQTVNCPFL